MLITVESCELQDTKVIIKGYDVEAMLMLDDAPEDYIPPVIKFVFTRDEENKGPIHYLYKVMQGQKSCQTVYTLGAKLDRLVGATISINNSFIVKR